MSPRAHAVLFVGFYLLASVLSKVTAGQGPEVRHPIEEREKAEALEDAKEMQRLRGARPGTPVQKTPRPLTQAILKVMRSVPDKVADPLDPTEDLEVVGDHDLPRLDPSLEPRFGS